MAEQRTFASLAWTTKGKVTRRERFLAEMNAVIPWTRLMKLIEPYYPKGGGNGQPKGLERMLRIYFVQHWFDLSDPAAEDAIYDSESIRRFVGVELDEDAVPDESTILRQARSGDAVDEEGQHVVLRNEGARGDGPEGARAPGGGDGRGGGQHQPTA